MDPLHSHAYDGLATCCNIRRKFKFNIEDTHFGFEILPRMSSATEDGRVCFCEGKHFMFIKKSVVQSKIKLMLKQVFVTQARPKTCYF
jgi:hypothetical protein